LELLALHRKTEYWDRYNFGVIACTIMNCTPRKSSKTYSPEDVVGRIDEKGAPRKDMTAAEMRSVLKMFPSKVEVPK